MGSRRRGKEVTGCHMVANITCESLEKRLKLRLDPYRERERATCSIDSSLSDVASIPSPCSNISNHPYPVWGFL